MPGFLLVMMYLPFKLLTSNVINKNTYNSSLKMRIKKKENSLFE